MIRNQEEDEFVAVRVQDPRIQNEGSWNSYVDFKIFLHTNSKAFTAKTSCVRRRYSEFVWLKKKLQKNAGLVPVPDLPGKSLFSFSNEDFLERRRKGLQTFLDKVVNMTVCLSDSQLHLFLQTQLPVGHIQDCVQGHTPYTVTDAILTYASSNRGLAQAQEDDSIKEPSLTVSYESMESPAPHQPCLQNEDTHSPELLSCGDSDPLDGLLELHDRDTAELQHKEKSSIRVLQKLNHLEAVVEDCDPTEVTFFLGDRQDDETPESLSLGERTQQRSCQIQTPVEVHSPMGTGFEENCGVDGVLEEERTVNEETSDTIEETVSHPDTTEKTNIENVSCEFPEKCVNSVAVLDFTDSKEQSVDHLAASQEDTLEDVCSEKQVLENHAIPEVSGVTDGHVTEVTCPEEPDKPDEQDKENSDELLSGEETALQSEIHEVNHNELSVPEVDCGDAVQQMDEKQAQQEVDVDGSRTKEDSDEDSRSLPSSNESIVKVSDEESICDETEAANDYMKTSPEEVAHWSEVEACSRNILDLQMNGCSEEKDLQYMADIRDLSNSLDVGSNVSGGDLAENSDFSILETSRVPELADSRCAEQETLSSLSLDASEETHEVEVH